ncbi:hypothetical protein LOS78_01895 [Paracoccus sp. MA]|uniref:hypothetical protein n=1 Tax=Paracoccus sp. MA TaxID=2895796 RepID=UPI001E3CE959|nr:hypothetical protein [Paracoccus sp. MA]UFM64252.1 hypothetical protein LOS78_01895 [Paracoccus sp. MA]
MADHTLLKASALPYLENQISSQVGALGTSLTNNLNNGRIWHTSDSNLANQTPPAGTDQVSVATNAGHITWRRMASPPGTPDPAIHVQTADGLWWYLSEDTAAIKARLTLAESSPFALNVGSPSGQAIPASRAMALTHVNGAQIWEVTAAPSDGIELDDLKQSSDGRWWLRVLDTRQSEFRTPRLFSSREDAATLLGANPPPAQVHRVFSVEGDRLNVRSRAEPNNDPLFPGTPYWGVEYSLHLGGSAAHPMIVGEPDTFAKLKADYGVAADMEVNWQVSDTGDGAQGWSVVGSGDTYTVPEGLLGRYLRFRTRGPATNMGWAISNVIGPIVAGAQTGTPLDIVSSVRGYGASRRRTPRLHASLPEFHDLRDGAGAAPPLDLYRDYSLTVGTEWLGQVTAPLPVAACNLLTTYTPPENVIHPCVVETFSEFCGWRYICAITAYPTGPSLEDPFVYGSNDRVNWTFLGGAPQPLAMKPAVTGAYNSDTFITHDPRTGELIVGWRLYQPRSEGDTSEANSDVVLMCRTTRNGYAWSEPREIMRIAADQQIMLAPTVIFDPATGVWHMWVINRPVMHHWTAPSLYGPWTLDGATTDLSGFTTPHHQEVKWIGDKLGCLLFDRGNGQLYFGVFEDGSWTQIAWNMTGVLNPRPASLYKASFVPIIDAGASTVAMDIWWTEGAAGPAGGTSTGHGRRLQYGRTNAAPVTIQVQPSETEAAIQIAAGVRAEIDAPYESVARDQGDEQVAWWAWDDDDHAMLGWSATGLRAHLDDWTVADAVPRALSMPDLEVDAATDEGAGVRVLERDEGDRALRVMRADGQDMIMSEEFTRREIQKAVGLGLLDPHGNALSTTAWQAISVNGQSLSVGGPWSGSAVTMAEFMARVDPTHALMLTGTVRGDAVPITTLDMPRSQGYNTSVPATGVAAATPSTSVVSAAAPLAYIVNAYRRDLGLPMVPIITQCHGVSGITIEDLDPDPETGSGSTTAWGNLEYWYQQVVAQAATQGKTLTVPWHDWVHGTSAQSYPAGQYEAALWRYQRDMRALLASLGAEGPALFIMSQPAGNANTTHASANWFVCDEMLAFCEAGGGVMATPEYAYQIADNNVHPDAYWTIQFQEVKGRAIAEVEAGRPWTIHRPKARVTGSQIVLDFDSLRPGEYLVLHDPARYGGEGIDAYAGFEALGAAITGMQIRGRQVILDCDAAPTGVRYAMQKQNVTGFAGNMWTAHRGLLRTSDVWPSKLLPGVDLYRWVPSFTLTF